MCIFNRVCTCARYLYNAGSVETRGVRVGAENGQWETTSSRWGVAGMEEEEGEGVGGCEGELGSKKVREGEIGGEVTESHQTTIKNPSKLTYYF